MILDEIVANKRDEIAARQRRISLSEFRVRAESAPPARDFKSALAGDHVALVAEIKRASPSRGALSAQIDSARLALTYAAHGASAISVLTDKKYFSGSLDDLKGVRVAVEIPVLRKDFIIDEYQIYESRALQADALLLIVRVLSDAQLSEYLALARSLGLSALVEIHDEDELDRALAANASLLGINNRNLADFTVDLATTERLAPRITSDRMVVAESGVLTRADVERVARVGVHAVLVGEALVRSENVGALVKELAAVRRRPVDHRP
jgi:indole-3-glycerol phosphate synthase